MTLAPVEIASPAPADMLMVPVLEAKPEADTAFSPLMETVRDPAAVAVCKLIFAPATRARETPVPVTLVPEALRVCVPAAPPPAPPLIPMMLAPLLEIVMFGPAEKEIDPALVDVPAPMALTRFAGAAMEMTDPVVMLRLAPTEKEGPAIVRVAELWLREISFPATIFKVVNCATAPPATLPPAIDVAETKMEAAEGEGPIMLIELAPVPPVVCESVMLLPAHKITPPEIEADTPAVTPPPEAEIAMLLTAGVCSSAPPNKPWVKENKIGSFVVDTSKICPTTLPLAKGSFACHR